jgi:hypothetical protein
MIIQPEAAKMAEKIVLELDQTSFPEVLKRYGPEGAKEQAIAMCRAQGEELTKVNLESALINLESDLEHMFA